MTIADDDLGSLDAPAARPLGFDVATFAVDGPLDLQRTCRPMAVGGDPTWRFSPGSVARSRRTSDGPASVEVRTVPGGVEARAWGPGAAAALADVPAMVGVADDRSGFDATLHPLVHRRDRQRPGARFGAAGSLWDAIVPTTLGQRVTSGEARHSWRRVTWRYGSAAPGPLGLRLGPGPGRAASIAFHDWHRMGVERRRAEAIRRMATVLPALERAATDSSAELQRVLQTLPGVGPWTATGLAISVLGDADCVLLGDLHVPRYVCHALAGEQDGTDDRMLQLLEPWAGHRGRVVRLVVGATAGPQKRGPRYAPLPISRM